MQNTDKSLSSVTVTLKSGRVITDDIYQLDLIEGWLDLTSEPDPISFEDCASVVDASGKDMLAEWRQWWR